MDHQGGKIIVFPCVCCQYAAGGSNGWGRRDTAGFKLVYGKGLREGWLAIFVGSFQECHGVIGKSQRPSLSCGRKTGSREGL